jgi:hypothetical protein
MTTKFPFEVWVEVLEGVLEDLEDFLETVDPDEEDVHAAVAHEAEVITDIIERARLLRLVVFERVH